MRSIALAPRPSWRPPSATARPTRTTSIASCATRAGSTLQALGLAKTLDWSGVTSVCDVGGGTGATLEQIVAAHPHLRATLLDLPEVVAGAKDPHSFEAVGGSFFDGVPSGFDR